MLKTGLIVVKTSICNFLNQISLKHFRVPDVMRMSDLDGDPTEPMPHRTGRTLAASLLSRSNGEYHRRGSKSSKSGSSEGEL